MPTTHPPTVVTLSIFPGVLAEDLHTASLGDWYPLLLMTLFNVSDFVAKNAPLLPPPATPGCAVRQRALLGWSVARVAFLPLFLAAMRWGAPAAVVATLCIALGTTNG